LFEDAEDFPPHPLHPPEDADGTDGEESGEYESLGGGVQPGGVSVKGPGPVGVIIRCIVISLYNYMYQGQKIDTTKSKIFQKILFSIGMIIAGGVITSFKRSIAA
jgi:hypothetical protein